jgi:SNF2 family DNA or RNA helicase
VRPFIPKGPRRYQHQVRGLQALIRQRGIAALLFDPGLGKTATVLDYASVLALKRQDEVRVLVVAPLVAVDTWVIEATKYVHDDVAFWAEAVGGSVLEKAHALASRGGNQYRTSHVPRGERRAGPRSLNYTKALAVTLSGGHNPGAGPAVLPTPRVIIMIVNLDTFSSRQRVGSKTTADVLLEAIKRYGPEMLVVDESHKAKGHGSQRSRLLDRVAQRIPRRVILTGTIMPQGPLDVFAQWRIIDPFAFGELQRNGSRKRATYDYFKNRFARTGGYMGREIKGYKNLDEMQDVMRKLAVVARKKDALEMPADLDVEVPVILNQVETDAYTALKKNLKATLMYGDVVAASNRLAQMTRLRQITSGHVKDDHGKLHALGTSKADVAVSLAHDTLEAEKRIVVFALFTYEIRLLEQKLARKGTEVLVIDGSTSDEDRLAMRARFGSDDPARLIMVAQITTMSLAVNELVTANHAIFASLSQRRDDIVQGRDRLHRIGQKKDCTFWFLIAPGTVDHAIYQAYLTRTSMEDAVLRHIAEDDADVAGEASVASN